jgi:ABC-type uncharacterized transport system auxiliary subunit
MIRINLFFLMAAVLVFGGCLGRRKMVQHYYTLEVPAGAVVPQQPDAAALPFSSRIESVAVDRAYAGTRIALRRQSSEIAYYHHHEWAVRPEYAFTRMLAAYLEERRIFKEVSAGAMVKGTDYSISVEVFHLEMVQGDKGLDARLGLVFRLFSRHSGEEILRHRCDRSQTLVRSSMNEFASAIGVLFAGELQQFEAAILKALSPLPGEQPNR